MRKEENRIDTILYFIVLFQCNERNSIKIKFFSFYSDSIMNQKQIEDAYKNREKKNHLRIS